MASGEKVVTLSHNKLQDLARKHEHGDYRVEQNDVPRGQQRSQGKSQKKPDVEIYRPGMSRKSKRNDTESSSHSSQLSPEVESVSHQLADVKITDENRGNNGVRLDTEQKPVNSTETIPKSKEQKVKEDSPTGEEKAQRRRQKRPDMKIYVPKPRQQHSEAQQQDTGPKMESSDKRTQGGGRVARGGVRQPRGRAKKTEDVDDYQNDMVVTVRSDGVATHRSVDSQTVGRRQQNRHWKEPGDSKRTQRQRSSDSIGSVEFLDDGLEWDYQETVGQRKVDIDVQPKGEEDFDDDFGNNLDFGDQFEVGLLGDLEEYEGLPVRPPMQNLLGIDTFDTLRDLDISLSGEEAFDEVLHDKNRKSKPGSARVKRMPKFRQKQKLQHNLPQDGDSPRSISSLQGFECDHEESPPNDQYTLTTKVPPLKNSQRKHEESSDTSPTRQEGEREPEIADVKDERIVVRENSRHRGRGHSYHEQRQAMASPKEPRKEQKRDKRDRQKSGKTKGKAEGKENEREAEKKENSNNRDKDGGQQDKANESRCKKTGDSGKGLTKGQGSEESGGDRKSAEKEVGESKANGGNKYTEMKNKRRGSSGINKGGSKKDNLVSKHAGLNWGDRMELSDEEIDFEHEVVDFGSESSSQSSVLMKGNTPTPESEKPSLGFDKYVADTKSHKQEEAGNHSQKRNRGKGRGRGKSGATDDDVNRKDSNRQGKATPEKSPGKVVQAKGGTITVSVNLEEDKPPAQTNKVTEYEMEGGNFDGLVITNSNYNNTGSGNSSNKSRSSPRRRNMSGDVVYSNERDNRNRSQYQPRQGSHEPGGEYDHHFGGNVDGGGEYERRTGNIGSRSAKQDRRNSERPHDQKMRRSPEGEGHYQHNRVFRQDKQRVHSSDRQRTMSHSSTESGPPSSAKGGGILHLPPTATTAASVLGEMHTVSQDSGGNVSHFGTRQPQQQQGSHIRHHHGNRTPERGRGRGRGRGGTHRTLYDPNNPQPKLNNPHTNSSSSGSNNTNTATASSSVVRSLPSDPNAAQPLHFHDSGEESPSAIPGGSHSPSFHPPFPASGSPMFHPPPPLGYIRGPGPGLSYMPPRPQIPTRMMIGGRAPVHQAYGQGFFHPHQEYGSPLDMNFGHPMMCEDDSLQSYNYDSPDPARSKSRSQNRDKAEEILRVVVTMETQLSGLLAKRIRGMEDFTRIMSLKKEFQLRCVEVMVLDPETSTQHNVEQLMWKTAFYQLIEIIRKEMASGESWEPYMLRQSLMGVLDEGDSFYEKLLQDLQSTFGFSLDQFYDVLKPYPSHLGRSAKLALYSAHICLLCLGDLARYREQINQTANYGKARSWYLKAQQVMPKNGRPYNQLAILAMYTKRKLEAVYYFMRSLAASNPFLNGREILMSIFDDIRKKAEVVEQKRMSEKPKQQRKPRQKSHRLEIWFHPDGSSSKDRIEEDMDDDDELGRLSANELNKRFTLSFLNVHGKLFTKIGMERFPETSSQLLHELEVLLQHSPCPLTATRLQQLVTINMFAVHNVVPRDQSQMDDNCRPLLQEYAVQLGLDMFALIANRCLRLLREHIQSGEPQLFSTEVEELAPSLILWGNWMTVQVDLWNPPPLPRDPELGPVIDVWQITAELIDLLSTMDTSHIKLYRQPIDGCEMLILPEASQVAGFVPLNLCIEEDRYVHSTVDKDAGRNVLRVEKLKVLAEVLAGIDEPLLKWSGETHRYEAVMKEGKETDERETDGRYRRESESSDVVIESESEEEVNVSGEMEEIRELKAKKEELQRQVQEKAKHEQSIRTMLEESQSTRVELEVHPTFLVPDTNCFIDHLPGIQRLLQARKYTLIVPLIVITELDGLSKGSKEGQYDSFEHAEKVKKGAQSTVEFLEREFEARNSHLRAITSKGNVMETIAFRSEDLGLGGNNDDTILSCCLHYCQDKARDFMPKDRDEPICLYREVVLLTDDRNLRLKAHTRNVPAKEVLKFLRWAKIG